MAVVALSVPPAPPGAVLSQLAEAVRPVVLAGEDALAVVPALSELLPTGLRRGSTVAVTGAGATSLALALCARASAEGSWVSAVGLPSLGIVAATEAGLTIERLVLVAEPPLAVWARVVAALTDAFDLILAGATLVREADARRVAVRLRERSSTLVLVGPAARGTVPVDLRLEVTTTCWAGLEEGHGRLAGRQVEVVAHGRGAASRRRQARLWLPAADGTTLTDREEGTAPAGLGSPLRRGGRGWGPDREEDTAPGGVGVPAFGEEVGLGPRRGESRA